SSVRYVEITPAPDAACAMPMRTMLFVFATAATAIALVSVEFAPTRSTTTSDPRTCAGPSVPVNFTLRTPRFWSRVYWLTSTVAVITPAGSLRDELATVGVALNVPSYDLMKTTSLADAPASTTWKSWYPFIELSS